VTLAILLLVSSGLVNLRFLSIETGERRNSRTYQSVRMSESEIRNKKS
jgi:hypothetical protein